MLNGNLTSFEQILIMPAVEKVEDKFLIDETVSWYLHFNKLMKTFMLCIRENMEKCN